MRRDCWSRRWLHAAWRGIMPQEFSPKETLLPVPGAGGMAAVVQQDEGASGGFLLSAPAAVPTARPGEHSQQARNRKGLSKPCRTNTGTGTFTPSPNGPLCLGINDWQAEKRRNHLVQKPLVAQLCPLPPQRREAARTAVGCSAWGTSWVL